MFRDIDKKKIRRRWWLRNIFWLVLLTATASIAYYLFIPFVHQVRLMETGQQEKHSFDTMSKEAHEHLSKNRKDWFKPGVMASAFETVLNINKVPQQGGWLNTAPLDLNYLRDSDHYILLYFWSASSFESQMANQYVEWLWQQYKDSGLVIVGIHSPQFSAEKKPTEVWSAIQKQGITFPVLLDGDKKIWDKLRVYDVPTQYLLNPSGKIVYSYVGVNNYQRETDIIRQKLISKGWLVNKVEKIPVFHKSSKRPVTPVLYAGYEKKRRIFGNDNQGARNKVASFDMPIQIDIDKIYLSGRWLLKEDYIESETPGEIAVSFLGTQSYAYLEAAGDIPQNVSASLYGEALNNKFNQKNILVSNTADLYQLTDKNLGYGAHELILHVPKGIRFYMIRFSDH